VARTPREREGYEPESRLPRPRKPQLVQDCTQWFSVSPSSSSCSSWSSSLPQRRRKIGTPCRSRRCISARYRRSERASERERERERERSSSLMDIAGLYVALGDLRLMHLVSANPHRPRRKRKDNGSPCSLQLYDRHRRSSRYEPCAPRLIGLLFRPATYHR
jgi:hypothetical protein